MIALALRGLRHESHRHLGSLVAISLGVALIGVVGLLIASVETYLARLGPGDEATRVALQDATSLLGVVAGFAGFMAIFVVASTCSFVVAARGRELGLLRLVGAMPRQVKRMIRVEVVAVAVLAAVLGCLLALLGFPLAAALLTARGLAPDGLPTPSPTVPLAIAAGLGVTVAWLGGWTASRRAAKVTPTAALRAADEIGLRLGRARLVWGVLCLVGGAAMLVGIRAGDPLLALMLAIFVPEVWVIALICLGPLLLPPVARLLTLPWREHPILAVARANVAARARRTTSLAAPVLAISAIAGSLLLTLSFAADWEQGITRQRLAAPLVVTTAGPGEVRELERVPGLERDPRLVAPVEVGASDDDLDFDADGVSELSVRLRGIEAHRGDLRRLTGRTVAISRSTAWDAGFRVGESVAVRFPDDVRLRLRVVALFEDAANLHGELLLPRSLVERHGGGPTGTWFVAPRGSAQEVVEGWDPAAGRLQWKEEWITDRDRELRAQNQVGLWAILAPSGGYAALAIANTLLLGSLQRRHELRSLRLIGASARQVRWLLAGEALIVSIAALTLGSVITVVTGWLLRAPMTAGLDAVPLTVPWGSLLAVAATCLLVAVVAAAAGSGRLRDDDLLQPDR